MVTDIIITFNPKGIIKNFYQLQNTDECPQNIIFTT